MKKAARFNYLFAAIVSLINLVTLLNVIISLFFGGVVCLTIFALYANFGFDSFNLPTFGSGLATAFGIWIAIPFMLPSMFFSFVFTILGFIGFSKLGNKKPLVIVNLIFGILGLINGSSLPSIFMIEGSIFGLSALDEEKKATAEQAELELQQVEDILEQ